MFNCQDRLNCCRQGDTQLPLVVPQPQEPQDGAKQKINKAIEGGLVATLNAGAVAALATTTNPKDVLSLASVQIITTTAKNLLSKAKIPRVVSYPVLIGSGVACFFFAPMASDVLFTIAAKNFTKDMKNFIKGKPVQLILTEGMQENLDRMKKAKAYCCHEVANSDQVMIKVDNAEDSESDEVEYTPPPKWVQAVVTTAVAGVGILSYCYLPLPNTGIALMETASKMATVSLRQLPLIPAGSAAVGIGCLGAGANSIVTGSVFSGPIASPALSFTLDVFADTIKMYMKGKGCRPFLELEEGGKKKKKDKELPSTPVQAGLLLTDAALAIGTNFAEPEGGMLPHKATGLFVGLFNLSCIKEQDSVKALGGRSLGYAAALGTAMLVDTFVQSPVKLTKVVGATVMKLFAAKEIKNISNLDFVGGYEYLKECVTGRCANRQ